MKKQIPLLLLGLLLGCSNQEAPVEPEEPLGEMEAQEIEEEPASKEEPVEETVEELEIEDPEPTYDEMKTDMINKYQGVQPTTWGENVPGVITNIATDEKLVSLTFDACDGTPGSFDQELIDFLIAEEIPATLFIGGQWIEEHPDEFAALADNPLFEIANHGYLHKPLSVNGASAYGIPGTADIAEVFDEIYHNQSKIEELTGEAPLYFRSGTAYYDEVAVQIANDLGVKVVNYNALGDAGGTFNREQIVQSLMAAQPGSIYLFHMNKPHSAIASGVREGVLHLKEQGYEFVQLHAVDELLR